MVESLAWVARRADRHTRDRDFAEQKMRRHVRGGGDDDLAAFRDALEHSISMEGASPAG